MKRTLKKTFAALIAVATMAVGMSGISANAYSDTASMVLRNMPGAPGNITSGSLTINSKTGSANYTTSYDFAQRTGAKLTVSTTNALTNKSVELTKSLRSTEINNVEARYSYITFSGNLTNSYGESGVWSVS